MIPSTAGTSAGQGVRRLAMAARAAWVFTLLSRGGHPVTSILDASPARGKGRDLSSAPVDLQSFALAVWSSPAWSATASTVVYLLLAVLFGPYGLGQTQNPYFVYLADALLHSQLTLVDVPPSTHDLSLYQGHYYLYWPPFPSLLFLPLVAALGKGVSDTLVTLLVAGLNVALVSWLLRALDARQVARLPSEKRAWLTAFFAMGTVQVTLAPYGRVWNTALLVGFALLCSAYLAALLLPRRWAPLAVGALVGGAFLSRNSTLLAAGWAAWYLWVSRDRSDRLAIIRISLAGLAPVAVAAMLQGGYNYLRFGNPLDYGLAYHQMAGRFQADYQSYGAFSLHYLPTNLFYDFVAFPLLSLLEIQPAADLWMGGSLFLMSPVFLLAVWGTFRWFRSHGWALALSCGVGLVPALVLMGTGWMTYGPRYTFDITVPLLVATALGASIVPTSLLARLSMISFVVYLPGAVILSNVMG